MGFALKLIEEGTATVGRAVRVLRRQFQQLVRLVDDLLDATRLSRNKIQVRRGQCDFSAVVRQAVDAVRSDVDAAGHSLTLVLATAPIWLEGDADRLTQVVMNLLNNAIRYTPAGGRITVSIDASGSEAVLSVRDTGVGLEPGDLQRVFEMFTQVGSAGSGGLGIGLSLVRGIVQLHNGRVEARSDGIGRGSEFRVMLPLMREEIAGTTVSDDDAADAVATTHAPLRILVVDDNIDSAVLMSDFLSWQGHTVRVEHNAVNALETAREFRPHTALLDIGLPGMDGYELARRLRAEPLTRDMHLVAVTGWGQDPDRARARDAGFDAHLTKPATPDHILTILGRGRGVDADTDPNASTT